MRARSNHGQPFAKILSKSHCVADELRTYKINLLGTNPVLPGNRSAILDMTGNAKLRSQDVLPGNHERAPGQPIQGNAKLCSRAT